MGLARFINQCHAAPRALSHGLVMAWHPHLNTPSQMPRCHSTRHRQFGLHAAEFPKLLPSDRSIYSALQRTIHCWLPGPLFQAAPSVSRTCSHIRAHRGVPPASRDDCNNFGRLK